MELITKVYGNGSSLNIDVTSLPQTYRDLRINGYLGTASGSKRLLINNFVTTGESIYVGGGSTQVSGTGGSIRIGGATGSLVGNGSKFELHLPGYTNTTIYKNCVWRSDQDGGSGGVNLWGGYWSYATAVTDIRFNNSVAWPTDAYFEIWGL